MVCLATLARDKPMATELKPLQQQVIVITGDSGIGLCTALLAAEKGAKVVLAARSDDMLGAIAAQIAEAGGEAMAVPTDVGDRAQLQALAEAAVARFGRIDSWVNDAGVAIYGRLDEAAKRTAGACSTPTSGAWSTARWLPCRTCVGAAAR